MKLKFTKAGTDAGAVALALETAGCGKFVAGSETDIVNGHVTVIGDDIEVVCYDSDEAPTKIHKSTFKKLNPANDALIAAAIAGI